MLQVSPAAETEKGTINNAEMTNRFTEIPFMQRQVLGSNVGDERRAKACAARFRTPAPSTGWATARRTRQLRAFADGSQTGPHRKPCCADEKRLRLTSHAEPSFDKGRRFKRRQYYPEPDRPSAGRRRTDSPAGTGLELLRMRLPRPCSRVRTAGEATKYSACFSRMSPAGSGPPTDAQPGPNDARYGGP